MDQKEFKFDRSRALSKIPILIVSPHRPGKGSVLFQARDLSEVSWNWVQSVFLSHCPDSCPRTYSIIAGKSLNKMYLHFNSRMKVICQYGNNSFDLLNLWILPFKEEFEKNYIWVSTLTIFFIFKKALLLLLVQASYLYLILNKPNDYEDLVLWWSLISEWKNHWNLKWILNFYKGSNLFLLRHKA